MFQSTSTHNKLKRSVSVLGTLLLSLLLVHCTEERPTRFDQGQKESFVTRADIDNLTVRIKTAGETSSRTDDHLALFEKPAYAVVEHNAPADYAFMFQDLLVVAQPNTEYDVVFKSQKGSLRAYIVVEDSQNLSLIQYQTVERYGDTGKFLVPIFSYPVTGYGVLESVLNDLEESTNRVRLAKTSWENATVIEIKKSPSERHLLSVPPREMESVGERIFLEAHLRGSVTDKQSLASEYEINVNVADEAVLYTMVSGKELFVYEATLVSLLDDDYRELFTSGRPNAVVISCTPEVAAKYQAAAGDQCVLLQRYAFDVEYVRASQVADWTDSNNQVASYSTDLTFIAAEPSENPGLLKIARDPKPREITRGEGLPLDPRVYLPVADLKEGEFLYRRMLQDVPNNVPGLFTTMTGPINIIKFRFNENRVEGYRTDASQQNSLNNPSDFETLFSIPAKYYRAENTDASGRTLPVPRLVETTATDSSPNLYVKMDWTQNKIENSGSPLSQLGFGNGLCFSSQSTRVSSVDNRLGTDGVMSFTIEGRYAATPVLGALCFGRYPGISGFSSFYGTDGNFNINERISIQKHNPEHDNFKSLDMPRLAQKAFNFGAISRPRYNPTASGRVGLLGTETNLAILHDFKNGPVTYVLKGVPERMPYGDEGAFITKEEMIDAVREVIADWNKVLKESFRGTPLETSRDLVLLKVDGIDIETKIGDLNVNHIYVEASATGVPYLGVYMGTPNPRSGLYEAGNVNIFAGNIMTSAENTQWASKIRKQYLENYGAAFKAAEQSAVQIQQQNQPSGNGPQGSVRPGGQVSGDAVAAAQGFISSLTASIAEIAPSTLFGQFSMAPGAIVSTATTILDSREVAAGQQVNPLLKNGSLVRLQDLADSLGRAGSLNISETIDSYAHMFPGDEQIGMLWLQKGMEGALEDAAKYGSNPLFYERSLIGAFLESHGSKLQEADAAALSSRYSQLTMQYLSQYGAQGMASCFYESMDVGSEVLAEMPLKDIFLSMFKHTTSHELGHALGLEHNFKGSVDKGNFNFQGEADRRLTSSIMEYGSALERAMYAGPGPYDAYALRAMYTGLVEIDPQASQLVRENTRVSEDGRKFLPIKVSETSFVPLWLHGDKFVQIDQMMDYFIGKGGNPNRISELDVLNMRLPIKFYEFCSNGFEYFDPTCNMFDAGSNASEIVDYYIGQYNASYELLSTIQDRTRFTVNHMFSNIGRTAMTYNQVRRFMDDAMFRLVNARGTSVFSSQSGPRNYQEYRALDSYIGAMKARNFLLSVVHTPDADGFTGIRERLTPRVVGVRDQNGSTQPVPTVIEKKWLYGRADNDYGGLSQAGFYIDKILALNFLSQRSSSRDLEGDILSLRAFSFLDFERFYMGIDSIEKSQVGRTLAQILSEDLVPMIIPTAGNLFMAPLDVDYVSEIPNSLRFYAGLNSILSLYVNAIQEDYNFGADFMVLREHTSGRLSANLDSENYLVDLSRDVNAPNVPKYFAFEGAYTKVASGLIQDGAFLREVLEDEINGTMEDLVAARMNLVLGGELGILTLPSDVLSAEMDRGVQEALVKKSNYEEARNSLLKGIARMVRSEEEAGKQIAIVENFVDSFLKMAPQIGPLAGAGQYQVISEVMQQLETMGKRNPFLVMASQSIESALTASTPKVNLQLVNFEPVALQILPSRMDLEVRYGLVRGNVDLLNRLTAILEPSARSN